MKKIKGDAINMDSVLGLTTLGRIRTEKIFSLKDAGIDSKIFHVWKSKGLVDFIEMGKWARMSFVEYLWLCVLETMRKFGCSVKLMKEIYEELFTKAYKDNLAAKMLKANFDHYKSLSKLRSLTVEESAIFEIIEYNYKYPQINTMLRMQMSYFYELVLDCLKYRVDSGIIIFEDESFITFVDLPETENAKVTSKITPHIYIPISSYILEFIADEEKQDFLIQTGLLSEDEFRVIREIRNKNVNTITISFRDNEHKIEKIVSDTKGMIKGDDAKMVMELLGLKNYSGIELSTRDGKTLSFTHTEKKFL